MIQHDILYGQVVFIQPGHRDGERYRCAGDRGIPGRDEINILVNGALRGGVAVPGPGRVVPVTTRPDIPVPVTRTLLTAEFPPTFRFMLFSRCPGCCWPEGFVCPVVPPGVSSPPFIPVAPEGANAGVGVADVVGTAL